MSAAAGLWAKLNLGAQAEIVLLDMPAELAATLAPPAGASVRRSLGRSPAGFVLAFATRRAQVEALAARLGRAVPGDAIVWIAYPKRSSRRYRCEFDRDDGFAALGAAGFEGVRQVAIDEDWSALRFRRVEFVRSLTRAPARALSIPGRARARAAARAR